MGDLGYLDDAQRLWFCGRKSHRVACGDARKIADAVRLFFRDGFATGSSPALLVRCLPTIFAGVFFAARSFIQKSLSGVGIVGASLLLVAVGFPEEAVPGEVDAQVLRRLGMGYAPLVTLLYLASIVSLTAYRITREDHEENLRRLREER